MSWLVVLFGKVAWGRVIQRKLIPLIGIGAVAGFVAWVVDLRGDNIALKAELKRSKADLVIANGRIETLKEAAGTLSDVQNLSDDDLHHSLSGRVQ
jgi:hypothetical protein